MKKINRKHTLDQWRVKNSLNLLGVNKIYVERIRSLEGVFVILSTILAIFFAISRQFQEIYSEYGVLPGLVPVVILIFFVTIPEKKELHERGGEISGPEVLNPDESDVEGDDKLRKIEEDALRIIEDEELYKIGGLSIRDVGDRMDVPPYLISQAVNSCSGQNFVELINRYRVEDAQELLKNPAFNHLSVLGIGFEAGFGSKTAFNTAFKKYTGVTPSHFKKNGLEVVRTKPRCLGANF